LERKGAGMDAGRGKGKGFRGEEDVEFGGFRGEGERGFRALGSFSIPTM
jgi:hypothetical protein